MRYQRNKSPKVTLAPILVIVLLVTFLFSDRASATDVSGPITVNTTWDLAHSPYNVVGSVTVNAGATLTIGTGCVVNVSGSATTITVNDNGVLSIGSGVVFKFNYASSYNLYVNGKLLANGTSGSPIYFTSYRDDNEEGTRTGGVPTKRVNLGTGVGYIYRGQTWDSVGLRCAPLWRLF